ncbi:MAG: carboxylate transporter, partial [Desulfobacula sp.]|nr:carboxylate transporter [Desulfobacula sp.]
SLSLYCDRLELNQLLKQMGAFDAQGSGTLNGRIPVTYSKGNISFDNGFLFSTPGKGGKVIIENSDKIISGIPMDSPQFSQLDLAREALKDFKYKWAKLKLHTREDTLFVNMELDGEPSNVLPFEYSKEFGGFIRVDGSSPGSHFQGIKLDINLQLPFNAVLKSGNKLKSIFN